MFFVLHLIPFNRRFRERLVDMLGAKRYKLCFRIVAVCILLLGIKGWGDFSNIYFYEPSLLLKQIHIAFMLPIVFLLVVAEVPNNFKRLIPHPMLTGVQVGALSHLLANGDLRSMIFFISFFVFATWARWASNKREKQPSYQATNLATDARTCLLVAAVYLLILGLHGFLFGMPVYQYVL